MASEWNHKWRAPTAEFLSQFSLVCFGATIRKQLVNLDLAAARAPVLYLWLAARPRRRCHNAIILLGPLRGPAGGLARHKGRPAPSFERPMKRRARGERGARPIWLAGWPGCLSLGSPAGRACPLALAHLLVRPRAAPMQMIRLAKPNTNNSGRHE